MVCRCVSAQGDTIVQLEDVIITDTQLRNYSGSQSVQTITDSVISRSPASLTALLNANTAIYFKENGLGMVSSPSFRGTTAQQTAVIWNGLNINSQLNGLTDFNTITIRDFSNITVRAGGGSVIYGSSAIGGSIHLNNDLRFGNRFSNAVRADYGSFNTLGLNYQVTASTDKFSAQASISRNSSDNDYEFVETEGRNINGQYYNTSLNTAFAYRINDSNMIKLYSYVFDSERHFSVIFPSETKTKYLDANTRNLLEWQLRSGKFTSKVKAAFLTEEYKYFQNINNESFTYGKVETALGRYDLLFAARESLKINLIADYTRNRGYGSDIAAETREIASASLLLSHSPFKKLLYEAGIRKEITSNYQSPLLYSFGIKFMPAAFYTLRLNGSRNFRIPTFNDLYWQGSGNTGLKPESSWQAEIGNEFAYKGFTLNLTAYYIKLTDMLRWVPAGSVWRPQNTDKVNSYGAEAVFGYTYTSGSHFVEARATYGYTRSEDELTGNQLIYVPYHKGAASLSYSYNRFNVYCTAIYTGEVFTRSDNNPLYNLDAYTTANTGAAYTLGSKCLYTLGLQVLNVLNADYQNVDGRPLPGRNYTMYITVKF